MHLSQKMIRETHGCHPSLLGMNTKAKTSTNCGSSHPLTLTFKQQAFPHEYLTYQTANKYADNQS